MAVVDAATADEALALQRRHRPDVIVVSLAPGAKTMTGLIARIQEHDRAPILALTDDADEAATAFDSGADAVASRRIGHRELAERTRALQRRADAQPMRTYTRAITLGPLHIEPETCEVFIDGAVLRTTPLEFKIIHALAQSPNSVVQTERLVRYLWGAPDDNRNSLRCHVSHLRSKLASRSRFRITAVSRLGYRLEGG